MSNEEAEKELERSCPECASAMQPIMIIDRSTPGGADGKLSYTAATAKRDMFFGKIHARGTIEAVVCTQCGRVLLYANPGGKP